MNLTHEKTLTPVSIRARSPHTRRLETKPRLGTISDLTGDLGPVESDSVIVDCGLIVCYELVCNEGG